jgi:D-alanyl-D-alanine dipeptidase
MSAATSSTGGPLKRKPSAPESSLGTSPLDCHSRRSEESAFSTTVTLRHSVVESQPARCVFSIVESRKPKHGFVVFLLAFAAIFSANSHAQTSPSPFPGPKPAQVAQDFINKTGDYANQTGTDVIILLERARHLYLRDPAGTEHLLNALAFTKERDQTSFTYASNDADAWVLAFKQRGTDPVWEIFSQIGPYHRLPYSVPGGNVNIVKPTRPVAEIRSEALAASPPVEQGPFRESDLVELTTLDRAIRLDIRYATSNDFLGRPVYTQARAFLQRPAAEALVRALHRLQPYGYGLLIHDGYRPWYVTKIFWDATPPEGKIFVADPAQGSRHNRGCAVDLTLYDLKTDEPIGMTGLYDEMSPRSFPDYPGGTSLQRWHRDLLR